MKHVLQCLIQPPRIHQCRPQKSDTRPRIIAKCIQRRIHILDINIRLRRIFRIQLFKCIDHHRRIIRNDNIRHQCIIILDTLQPSCPQKPV